MKRKNTVLLAVSFVVLISLAFILLRACDTSTYYMYATYADIEKDKTVKGASVPAFVPRSAVDIAGWYTVEFSEQTLEFSFDLKDTNAMVSSFREVRNEDAEAIKQEMRRYSWEKLDKEATIAIYVKDDGTYDKEYLAVDTTSSRAFYLGKGGRTAK